MRASRAGLAFRSTDTALTVAIWTYGSSLTDPKSAFVIKQLPIAPTHGAAWKLGILPFLSGFPSPIAYMLLLLPILLFLYGIGWLLGLAWGRMISGWIAPTG